MTLREETHASLWPRQLGARPLTSTAIRHEVVLALREARALRQRPGQSFSPPPSSLRAATADPSLARAPRLSPHIPAIRITRTAPGCPKGTPAAQRRCAPLRVTQLHHGATCSSLYTCKSLAVAVSDEQWRAFRTLAVAREISVSAYLGRLVAAELERRKATAVAPAGPEVSELDRALAALVTLRASIDELDDIAGRLARTATARGATWQQVANPLRLSAEVAERAFGRDDSSR
jgi:hypothetical protein